MTTIRMTRRRRMLAGRSTLPSRPSSCGSRRASPSPEASQTFSPTTTSRPPRTPRCCPTAPRARSLGGPSAATALRGPSCPSRRTRRASSAPCTQTPRRRARSTAASASASLATSLGETLRSTTVPTGSSSAGSAPRAPTARAASRSGTVPPTRGASGSAGKWLRACARRATTRRGNWTRTARSGASTAPKGGSAPAHAESSGAGQGGGVGGAPIGSMGATSGAGAEGSYRLTRWRLRSTST